MKNFAKLGLVSILTLNLAIPQSTLAAKKHTADSDKIFPATRTEDKELKASTVAALTKVGGSEEGVDATFADPEFKKIGKNFVEAVNEVKPCRSGCDPDVEKEKSIAHFLAWKLVPISKDQAQKSYDEYFSKKYDELLEKPTADSQSDEVTKRLTVALANWDPFGKMTKPWEPTDERMKTFFKAFMEVKGEYEKLRKDQDKTLAEAAKGNEAAKRKLYGDPDKDPEDKANRLAVGGDIMKRMQEWAENGQEGKAVQMWKALASKDGTLAFKNGKNEMVHYTNVPMTTKGIVDSLKDPKMADWTFLGHPAEQGQAKDFVWNNGAIEAKPANVGGVNPQKPGVPQGQKEQLTAAKPSAQSGINVQTCNGCHNGDVIKAKGLQAAISAVQGGRMPPSAKSNPLTPEDKNRIAGLLNAAATGGQVAAK